MLAGEIKDYRNSNAQRAVRTLNVGANTDWTQFNVPIDLSDPSCLRTLCWRAAAGFTAPASRCLRFSRDPRQVLTSR